MGAHSRVTTRVTAIASTRTVLRSKIVGAQVGPSLVKRDRKAQILCSSCAAKSRRPYANTHARTRNTAQVNQAVIVTPITVPEGVGWIALGNQVYVRNVN